MPNFAVNEIVNLYAMCSADVDAYIEVFRRQGVVDGKDCYLTDTTLQSIVSKCNVSSSFPLLGCSVVKVIGGQKSKHREKILSLTSDIVNELIPSSIGDIVLAYADDFIYRIRVRFLSRWNAVVTNIDFAKCFSNMNIEITWQMSAAEHGNDWYEGLEARSSSVQNIKKGKVSGYIDIKFNDAAGDKEEHHPDCVFQQVQVVDHSTFKDDAALQMDFVANSAKRRRICLSALPCWWSQENDEVAADNTKTHREFMWPNMMGCGRYGVLGLHSV